MIAIEFTKDNNERLASHYEVFACSDRTIDSQLSTGGQSHGKA